MKIVDAFAAQARNVDHFLFSKQMPHGVSAAVLALASVLIADTETKNPGAAKQALHSTMADAGQASAVLTKAASTLISQFEKSKTEKNSDCQSEQDTSATCEILEGVRGEIDEATAVFKASYNKVKM